MTYTNPHSYDTRVGDVVVKPGESIGGAPKKTKKKVAAEPPDTPTPSGDEQSEEDDQ